MMTIRELQNLDLFDDYERVAIFEYQKSKAFEKVIYKGCLCEIPDSYLNREIEDLGGIDRSRITEYHLNDRYGIIGIWIWNEDDEDDEDDEY